VWSQDHLSCLVWGAQTAAKPLLSCAATDAQGLYAEPSHWMCSTSGDRHYLKEATADAGVGPDGARNLRNVRIRGLTQRLSKTGERSSP
jgi:hypothetical protein